MKIEVSEEFAASQLTRADKKKYVELTRRLSVQRVIAQDKIDEHWRQTVKVASGLQLCYAMHVHEVFRIITDYEADLTRKKIDNLLGEGLVKRMKK